MGAMLIDLWKERVSSIIKLRNPETNLNKLDKQLDKLIEKRITNFAGTLINNYKHVKVKTDLLGITDMFFKNNVILGGEGVFFMQHKNTDNPLIRYIAEMMSLRKIYKKKRDQYDKGTEEYAYYDTMQLNTKIVINSLYGVLGYKKFHLYNVYLAQSITAMGQNIISSAACGFENFLADNVKFKTESELYSYINTIYQESDNYSDAELSLVPEINADTCYKRLLGKCDFNITDSIKLTLLSMVEGLDEYSLRLVYYKNNLYEFMNTPMMQDLLEIVITKTDILREANIDLIEDIDAKRSMELIIKYLQIFVLYDYPVFDRVRRTKFTITKNVLYIDTDSNFISLAKWIRYSKKIGERNNLILDSEYKFKCVSLMTLILTDVVSHSMHTLCKYQNITDEHAKNLSMKNEFYFSRIIFTTKKKRYSSQMILQEGKLLNNGFGFTETKGFNFIKSITKPTLKKFYEDLLLNEVLIADEIHTENIIRSLLKLRNDISESILSGDSLYYKQASVKLMELYKTPYSIQGVKAVTTWNALAPEYAIELPADVDIVAIKINNRHIMGTFKERFPDRYELLRKNVLEHPDERVRNLKLDAIAKPRSLEEMPDWLQFIIDPNKIINDAVGLFNPVIEALDIPLLRLSSTTSHFSNIIPPTRIQI